jgi:PEGA domain
MCFAAFVETMEDAGSKIRVWPAENLMSKVAILLAFLIAGLPLDSRAQSPAPQHPAANTAPVNVVLADGTPVKLRLGSANASNAVRVGENLELEVTEDVRVADVVVIARGSVASAEVTNLRSGVSNGRGGWIDINLESVALSDGQRVPIRASKEKPVHGDQTTIVSSSGQDASITQGTDLTTFINGNQPLDLTRLRAASGPTTQVKVTSTPPNAEITVDGRLAGSTPYTLHVTAGDHIVVLRMVGFQPWQRKLHVAAEPMTVDIPLLKQDGTEAMPTSKPAEPSLGDIARAARVRKPQPANPPASEPNGQGSSNNQTGQRDPMEPPATPKQ